MTVILTIINYSINDNKCQLILSEISKHNWIKLLILVLLLLLLLIEI